CEPATILIASNQPINMPTTAVQRERRSGRVKRGTCRLCSAVTHHCALYHFEPHSRSNEHAGPNLGIGSLVPSAMRPRPPLENRSVLRLEPTVETTSVPSPGKFSPQVLSAEDDRRVTIWKSARAVAPHPRHARVCERDREAKKGAKQTNVPLRRSRSCRSTCRHTPERRIVLRLHHRGNV